MHLYKKIAQSLLVLSVLNLVFAAPVVPRGTPPGGETPSQYPSSSDSSDESPPDDSLPLEGSASLQGSAASAPSSGSSPSSHLPATDGRVPAHDSTTEAPTFAHPLSAADGPAPEPDSTTEAPTFAHPLSAADWPAPESDRITEASTSLHDSTAEVSTTETSSHATVAHDILPNGLSIPVLKKIAEYTGRLAAVAALTVGTFAFSDWLHKKFVEKYPDSR
jgi:hypothetical protein